MFRSAYQNGFLSILYSCGSSPLAIWDKQVKNGYIKRVTDDEVKSLVLEIAGTNVATTFIFCPQDPKKVLGIKLPFLIMIIKNMKKYFTFEITILDDKNMHRRFRVSNFQSTTRVRPFCTTMPIGLSGGWNQIQFNLADFTRRAYGSNYVETTRMQIHANCRIRRIYYADRLYSEDEMPEEFKLFLPIHRRKSSQNSQIIKSVSANKVREADGDRLADEPPPFSVHGAPEGGEGQGTGPQPGTESPARRQSESIPSKTSSSKYRLKTNAPVMTITEDETGESSVDNVKEAAGAPAEEQREDEEESVAREGEENEERNETNDPENSEDQLEPQMRAEEAEDVEADSSVGEEG